MLGPRHCPTLSVILRHSLAVFAAVVDNSCLLTSCQQSTSKLLTDLGEKRKDSLRPTSTMISGAFALERVLDPRR